MSENTTELEERSTSSQWHNRPLAALLVRLALLLCPVGVAALLGLLVSRAVPAPTTTLAVLRGLLTAAVSLAAFVALDRAGRRFLPLAVLLRLNLVFPDRAPSRFSVSLRSTNVRKLERFVHEARTTDDAVLLAERVVTLASALNTHDRRTRGHCERTRALADLIVEELHLAPLEANQVRWGAFLHDIGKLVVPVEILNKPGKPTPSEWEVLRSHPEAGARLVEPLRVFLSDGVDAVGSHHENYDGSGYPTGRSGEDLPLAARIVSVADAFEVMTAVRAYKRPLSLQAARAELTRKSGTQFDPTVVRAFLNVSRRRVHWSLGMAAWLAELPFLAALPRALVQLQAATGVGGTVSPAALPGIAAASLGAIAVVIPLHPTSPSPAPSAATSERSVPAAAAADAPATASSTAPASFSTAASSPSARSASSSGSDYGAEGLPTTITVPTVPVLQPVVSTVTTALSPLPAALAPDGGASPSSVTPPSLPASIDQVLVDASPVENLATTAADDVEATVAAVDQSLGFNSAGRNGGGVGA